MELFLIVLTASSVLSASLLSTPRGGDCLKAFNAKESPSLRTDACLDLLADVVPSQNARRSACETIRDGGACSLLENATFCDKMMDETTSDRIVAEFVAECPTVHCLRARYRLCAKNPLTPVSRRGPHFVRLAKPVPGIAFAEFRPPPFTPPTPKSPPEPSSPARNGTRSLSPKTAATQSPVDRRPSRSDDDDDEQMLIGIGVGIGGIIVIVGAGIMVLLRWRKSRAASAIRTKKEMDDVSVAFPEDPVAVVGTLRTQSTASTIVQVRMPMANLYCGRGEQHPIRDDDVYTEQVCPKPFVVPGRTMDSLQQQFLSGKFTTPEVLRESLQSDGTKLKETERSPNCNVYSTFYRGEAVDLKTLARKHSQENRLQFLQEAFIHAQFCHQNVVQLVGMVTVDDPLMMVMEWTENGALQQYIQKYSGGQVPVQLHPAFPPGTNSLFVMAHNIASGMTYLEAKNFVHGALMSSNILVSVSGACKISNFEASLRHYMRKEKDPLLRLVDLPVRWSAPEVLECCRFSVASDVWSYGIVLYELWSFGAKPYEYLSNIKVAEQVKSGYRLPCPPHCPAHVHRTMLNCWNANPTDRPTFRHLLSNLPAIAETC